MADRELPVLPRDDRPDVYPEGDAWVYRASALGSCLRALVAARLGYEREGWTPKPLQQAAEQGQQQEPKVLAELQGLGYTVVSRQQTVELAFLAGSRRVILRGHTDAITQNGADRFVVEVKTMSPEVAHRFLTRGFGDPYFRRYAYQASFYVYRTGLPMLYAVKERESGDLVPRIVATPPVRLDAILARVRAVEQAAASGSLPDCDQEGGWCPYRYLCQHRADAAPTTDGEQAEAVDLWAGVYLKALEDERRAQEAKAQAKAKLEELSPGRDPLVTGRFRVRWLASSRTDYDTKAMERKLPPEVLAPFRKVTEIKRISVEEVG